MLNAVAAVAAAAFDDGADAAREIISYLFTEAIVFVAIVIYFGWLTVCNPSSFITMPFPLSPSLPFSLSRFSSSISLKNASV